VTDGKTLVGGGEGGSHVFGMLTGKFEYLYPLHRPIWVWLTLYLTPKLYYYFEMDGEPELTV